MIIPNPKVYEAARCFAQGESVEKVKELLLGCLDFEEDTAEEVILSAGNHINEIDHGYSAFINCVNIILDTDAYCLECTGKKSIKVKCVFTYKHYYK